MTGQRYELGANAVRRRLGGISPGTLARLAREKKLAPSRVDDRGWKFYDPDVVEAFAATYARSSLTNEALARKMSSPRAQSAEGRRSKRVFECFAAGVTDIRAIVLKTGVAPGIVRELYREWTTSLAEGEEARRAAEAERVAMRDRREAERLEQRQEMARLERRRVEIAEREARARERALRRGKPAA